jgi:hypothetical protein
MAVADLAAAVPRQAPPWPEIPNINHPHPIIPK